jgi:hypothetical protein
MLYVSTLGLTDREANLVLLCCTRPFRQTQDEGGLEHERQVILGQEDGIITAVTGLLKSLRVGPVA